MSSNLCRFAVMASDIIVLCQRAVVDKVELVSFWSDGDIIVLYQRAVVDKFETVSL